MASLAPYIFSQFFDNDGVPLDEGTLTFYATETTTPLDTYSDASGETENQNPLELDSAGRSGPIFLGPNAYDIILKNSAGTTIETFTGVSASGGGGGSLSVVPTLDDLRALAAGAADYLLLGGNAALGDGGSYLYYWSAGSVAADNGTTVVEPDSLPASGRWLLMPFNNTTSGTFNAGLTAFTVPQSGTGRYVRSGDSVTMFIPAMSGTASGSTLQLSGIPAAIRPTRAQTFILPNGLNNGGSCIMTMTIQTNGTADFNYFGSLTSISTSWTSGSTIGFNLGFTFTYFLL